MDALRTDLLEKYKFVGATSVDSINAFRQTQTTEAQIRGRIQSQDILATAQMKWIPCDNVRLRHFDIDIDLCARCPYHPIFCYRLFVVGATVDVVWASL